MRLPRDGERQEVEVEGITVVVGGLLRVAAVGVYLRVTFTKQDGAASIRPSPGGLKLRKNPAGDIERQRFTEKVCIRTEVEREVPLDLRELSLQPEQEIQGPDAVGELAEAEREMQRPNPGNASKCELEHASPVDARERRIGAHPIRQFVDAGRGIMRFARQPRCTPKCEPMLVAIEFPDDLVIAAAWIEVGHLRPEHCWRTAVVYRIEVPVDGGRIAFEREVFKAEEIVSVCDKPGGPTCC